MNFVSSVDSNTCLRDFIPSDKVHICEKGTGTFFNRGGETFCFGLLYTLSEKTLDKRKMTSSAELSETLAEGNGDNHHIANYVQVAPLGV